MKHQEESERGLLIDMNELDMSAASVKLVGISIQALATRSDSFLAASVASEGYAQASSCNLFC